MPKFQMVLCKECLINYVHDSWEGHVEFILIPVDDSLLSCSMTTERQRGKDVYFISPFSSAKQATWQSGWISNLEFRNDTLILVSWADKTKEEEYKVYIVERGPDTSGVLSWHEDPNREDDLSSDEK